MKRASWWWLLLIFIGLSAFLESRPPKTTVSLLQLIPQASPGPVLFTDQILGSYQATPFLDHGWGPITNDPFRSTTGLRPPWGQASGMSFLAEAVEERSELRFYLTQRVPLVLDLEGGSMNQKEVLVNLLLNGRLLEPITVSPEFKHFPVKIDAAQLNEGCNQLLISSVQSTKWRTCVISPLHCDIFRPESPVGAEKLYLSFGKSKEIPILLRPSSWLVLDDLAPWVDPGGPGLPKGWELLVRIQSGEKKLDETWHLTKRGEQRVRLPIQVPTLASLSLLAMPSQDMLPGQRGLVLVKPRVDSWSSPDKATPQKSAVPEPAPLPPSSDGGAKPNVILYLIDTLRSDHLHCYGYRKPTTPHLDALAADGVRFADCTAQASWTKPATASILTSLLPHQHHAEDFPDVLVLPEQHSGGLDGAAALRAKTLAQTMLDAGYETRGVVNNPMVFNRFGFGQGFQTYQQIWRPSGMPKADSDAHHTTSNILAWLDKREEKKRRPFFLYVHVVDPHVPYEPPKRFRPPGLQIKSFGNDETRALERAERASTQKLASSGAELKRRLSEAESLYDGEIANCDDAFGNLVEALKSHHLYDNTMIVVVSDHGEQFLEHGLLNHMNSQYQELLHVPLIIKFPHNRAAGTVAGSTWQQIDVAPTILSSTGIFVPIGMMGKAYSPGCAATPNRPAYFSTSVGRDAELFGQGKGLRRFDADGIRVGHWVFNRTFSSVNRIEPEELFDLDADPKELHNLAYERPEIRVWLAYLLRLQAYVPGSPTPPRVPEQVLQDALNSLQYVSGP